MKEIWKEIFGEVPKWLRWTFIGIIAGSFLLASLLIKSYPQDNAIEEMLEAVIKENTGEDIDLSPQSPELDK